MAARTFKDSSTGMLYTLARAALVVLACSLTATEAFSVPAVAVRHQSRSSSLQLLAPESSSPADAVAEADCGCEEGVVVPSGILMNDVRVTGSTLRGMTLADAGGQRVESGSLLGAEDGRAIVVFLRHLG